MIGVRFTSDESDKVLLSRNPARFDAAIGRLPLPARERPQRRSHESRTSSSASTASLTTINALRSAPGRKAVILVTDGLTVESEPQLTPVRDPTPPSIRCSRTGTPTPRCG